MRKRIVDKKGLTLIYYGRGKGKTTAALGLAMRAVGMGLNVYIMQFIKGEWPSGERNFIEAFNAAALKRKSKKKIGRLKIIAGGRGFVKILGDKKPFSAHKKAALKALELSRRAMLSGKYDVVILDECISAVEVKLIKVSELLKLARLKPVAVHLVMTGHILPKLLASRADLVSEVKMVKHPYYRGVLAQAGIDF